VRASFLFVLFIAGCAAPATIPDSVAVTTAPLAEPATAGWTNLAPVVEIDGAVTAVVDYDVPPLAPHACATSPPFTVSGIDPEWLVAAGPRSPLPDALMWRATVPATDQLQIKVCNLSDAPVDAPPAKWSVLGTHFRQ
jgi:hypothetical protein